MAKTSKVKAKEKKAADSKKSAAQKAVAKKPSTQKQVAKKKPMKKPAAKVSKAKPSVKTIAKVAPKITLPRKKSTAAAAPAPAAAPIVMKVEKIEKFDFIAGDFVVYPAHGVGQVEGVETQTIGGMEVSLYTICFEKDRMRLKLPVTKVKASGLRKLSSKDRLKDALSTLQGRSQVRRIMWSRRAQEYEAKINSGDPVSIAEVLRDLKRADDQSEQSYSERQIYQAALERLAREVAAIEKIDEKKAAEKLEAVLTNVA